MRALLRMIVGIGWLISMIGCGAESGLDPRLFRVSMGNVHLPILPETTALAAVTEGIHEVYAQVVFTLPAASVPQLMEDSACTPFVVVDPVDYAQTQPNTPVPAWNPAAATHLEACAEEGRFILIDRSDAARAIVYAAAWTD